MQEAFEIGRVKGQWSREEVAWGFDGSAEACLAPQEAEYQEELAFLAENMTQMEPTDIAERVAFLEGLITGVRESLLKLTEEEKAH